MRGRRRFRDRQNWIEQESCSHEIALAWGARILDATRHLSDFPDSGRVVPEINRVNIREVIVDGEYRVIYKVSRASCDILSGGANRPPHPRPAGTHAKIPRV